jgi:hypothetical protein
MSYIVIHKHTNVEKHASLLRILYITNPHFFIILAPKSIRDCIIVCHRFYAAKESFLNLFHTNLMMYAPKRCLI